MFGRVVVLGPQALRMSRFSHGASLAAASAVVGRVDGLTGATSWTPAVRGFHASSPRARRGKFWPGSWIGTELNDDPKTPQMAELFRRNRRFIKDSLDMDPEYFSRLAGEQHPKFMFIGCADSRVTANLITGFEQGELFVHRNIANMVVGTDLNMLSVLQYAVEVLGVEDILVCGHYGCGGVKAAMQRHDAGLIEHWLRNIREVYRIHKDELDNIEDEDKRFRRLVELNVGEQCINLFKTGIVQKRQVTHGVPRIHGLVYDIADGKLRKLEIDFKGYVAKYGHVFALHDFSPSDGWIRTELNDRVAGGDGDDEAPAEAEAEGSTPAASA